MDKKDEYKSTWVNLTFVGNGRPQSAQDGFLSFLVREINYLQPCYPLFIPSHRKYIQLECTKATVYLSVFHRTFSSISTSQVYHTHSSHLATVFSMAWYKIVSYFLWYTMEYPTCHLYFLGIHTRLNAWCVFGRKEWFMGLLFHSIPLESIST